MKQLISILIFLFVSIGSYAQSQISGKILDEQQQPISNVSVSYKKVGGQAILGFGKTDSEGKFKLEIRISDTDSVQLDFNHLSYAKKSVTVVNSTAHYAYKLQQQAREIKEVNVANIPVYKRKDTINYTVDAFTSKQDRVIGDIIKKLPGIEMDGERILYQGKPIQKYMVNNLDLMEGRYGMINKNLPADAVRRVQVVENDQPIKILDSLVFSEQASLNLELKRFTSTGTGKVGAGMSPALWDLNLTPMTFDKTFQMLNSVQTNNVGYDAARELRPFYTGGGYFGANANIKDGPTYLHVRNVSSPGFEEKKWLDNKLFLTSSNMLKKLDSGIELKGNVSYYDDSRQRQGFTSTQYFTADEVIYNSESVDNRYRINALDVGVLLEKNEKQVYLRNSFKYHQRWNTDWGNLLFDERDLIGQKTNYRDAALLNNLSIARFIGKQLVNINSKIEWHNTPQRLSVSPGQFTDILNNGEPYEQMGQDVRYNGLNWENSLSFMRRFGRWTIAPSVGLNYSRNDLDTYITVHREQEETVLGEDYRNDMVNSQLNLATSLRLAWENPFWKFHFTVPYNLYYFHVRQQEVTTLDNTLKNTLNPSAGLTYLMDAKNELSAGLSGGRQYGGLDNFYNGYIIGQYRSMQRYDARLLRTDNRSARVGYNYKNTLRANFANVSYSYSEQDRDYIFTTHIDALGRSTTSIADQQSGNSSHSISAGVSRFFSSLKTVAKLNGQLSWSKADYLLNDALSVQYNQSRSGSVELINSLSNVVSGEYKMSLQQMDSKLAAGRRNKVYSHTQHLNMMLYPSKLHTIIVSNALYSNNMKGQKDQFFLDATYRYRVEKWRTDIELVGQNLLNNSQYIQQFSNNIELVQSYFELRPRQFLISTRFKF